MVHCQRAPYFKDVKDLPSVIWTSYIVSLHAHLAHILNTKALILFLLNVDLAQRLVLSPHGSQFQVIDGFFFFFFELNSIDIIRFVAFLEHAVGFCFE